MRIFWKGGKRALPFQTIKSQLLSAIASGEKEITVLLSGRHTLSEPLSFGAEFGGYDASVRFVAEKGCRLDFTLPVSYERGKDGICRAALVTDLLVQGGRPLRRARFPQKGYLRVAKTCAEDAFQSFYFQKGDIPEGLDTDGLSITVWPGGAGGRENWHTMTVPVGRIDYASCRLYLDRPSPLLELGAGTRYFLENSPVFLQGEGTFCSHGGQTLFLPRRAGEVRAAGCKNLIRVCGGEGKPVRNFSFEGLDLRFACGEEFVAGEFGQYRAAVYFSDTENCAVSGCAVSFCGGHGVCLYGNNRGARIAGNHIHAVGHTGVVVIGNDGRDFVSEGHLIRSNHIHDVGMRVGHGCGVQLMRCAHTEVSHNLINHSPRYAVSVLGFLSAQLEGDRLVFSKSEGLQRTVRAAHDILICANDVYRCNLDSQDTGVIQAYHAGPDIAVRENYVHDSDIPFSFGTGIYLDDCCTRFTVERNVLARLQKGGAGSLGNLMTLKGDSHVVRKNVCRDCGVDKNGALFCSLYLDSDSTSDLTLYQNYAENCGKNLYVFTNWSEGRVTFSDCNVCGEEAGVIGGYGDAARVSLAEWGERDRFDVFTRTLPHGCAEEDAPDIEAQVIGNAGPTDEYGREKSGAPRALHVLCGGVAVSRLFVRTGEPFRLSFCTSDRLGLKAPCTAQVQAEEGLLAGEDGSFVAESAGVYALTARCGDVRRTVQVFADERIERLELLLSAPLTVPAKGVRAIVRAYTDAGRSFLPQGARLNVQGGSVREDPVGWTVSAEAEGTLRLFAEYGGCRAEAALPVAESMPERVECESVRRILRQGESAELSVCCFDQKGNPVLPESISVRSAEGRMRWDGTGGRALRAGEDTAEIDVCCKGVNRHRRLSFSVVPQSWREVPVCNVGGCGGRAFADGKKRVLYSDGANIWFDRDNFTAAELSEGESVCAVLESLHAVHADSQAGLVMRASADEGAQSVNLRADASGKVMIAVRGETGGQTRCVFEAKAAFPLQMQLKRESGRLIARVDGREVWNVPDPFADGAVCALALFSVNTRSFAQARFSRVGEEL